jgi:hypothetical protein
MCSIIFGLLGRKFPKKKEITISYRYGYIDQRVPDMTIVFSTIMLWYSGFLPYQNELVKTYDETAALDVCMIDHIMF